MKEAYFYIVIKKQKMNAKKYLIQSQLIVNILCKHKNRGKITKIMFTSK